MKKDCLTTFSKVDFNTFEPEEDKIRIEDIAHALSVSYTHLTLPTNSRV